MGATKLSATIERWPLRKPFHISGYTFFDTDVVVVTLERDGVRGWGEASGVYYRDDDVQAVLAAIESVRPEIEAGIGRDELLRILPAAGARNAIDCALWDLEAKLTGLPVWKLAGLNAPQHLLTTFTLGADAPEEMQATALEYASMPIASGQSAAFARMSGSVSTPTPVWSWSHCNGCSRHCSKRM